MCLIKQKLSYYFIYALRHTYLYIKILFILGPRSYGPSFSVTCIQGARAVGLELSTLLSLIYKRLYIIYILSIHKYPHINVKADRPQSPIDGQPGWPVGLSDKCE